jgi:endonuclease III
MKPEHITPFFAALAAQRPAPRTELEFTNDFTLLVAVVLSAQATDKGVNKATGPLFARASNPQAMVDLGEAQVLEHVKSINFARTKARNVMALSRMLVERHGGQVPQSREALEALPGVGRKTANVILNSAFGQPVMAVDTHIFRVCNRTGLAPGRSPLEVEQALERVVPMAFRLYAHHWLLLHGRYVCKARRPECAACIVSAYCAYPEKTL